MMTIEYRVRPVTRYVVTRYHSEQTENTGAAGCDTRGEFENYLVAHEVATALCAREHGDPSYPKGTVEFVFPAKPACGDPA